MRKRKKNNKRIKQNWRPEQQRKVQDCYCNIEKQIASKSFCILKIIVLQELIPVLSRISIICDVLGKLYFHVCLTLLTGLQSNPPPPHSQLVLCYFFCQNMTGLKIICFLNFKNFHKSQKDNFSQIGCSRAFFTIFVMDHKKYMIINIRESFCRILKSFFQDFINLMRGSNVCFMIF